MAGCRSVLYLMLAAGAGLWSATLNRLQAAGEGSAVVSLRAAAGGVPLMGTAVAVEQLDRTAAATFIAGQFDCLTPENQLKPAFTEPRPGRFNFGPADRILAFTQAHGMKMIGHNLCWHSQTPAWMYQDSTGNPLPRTEALANLKRHIDAVVGHYKGKIFGWDVVNEALSDLPGEYLRNSPAKRAIGDDFIIQAFKFAHAADPDAELYYNDYSNENPEKRAQQIRLIRDLKAAGCRLDAVGIQGHFMLQFPGTAQVLDQAITAFASEGVKVCITELDVDVLPRKTAGADVSDVESAGRDGDPYTKEFPAQIAETQADFYRKLFEVILRHRKEVERVTFWGIDDGASWLNTWPVRGRTNHPLLFDRSMQPKPAFFAVIKTLQNLH
jgi:endo-1,4-beta-xylanase